MTRGALDVEFNRSFTLVVLFFPEALFVLLDEVEPVVAVEVPLTLAVPVGVAPVAASVQPLAWYTYVVPF